MVLEGFLNLLFPPHCLLCDGKYTGKGPVCNKCWSLAQAISPPLCSLCGLPLLSPDEGGEQNGHYLCHTCRERKWGFDKARAAYFFEGPVREVIHLMKYSGHFRAGEWLGRLMAEALPNSPWDRNAVIVPVPLPGKRWREREFNQSLIMGKAIGKAMGMPVSSNLLQRSGTGSPQVGLNPKERWANVRGAFTIKDPGSVRGKRVVVVDDVFTTGATVHECSRVLKAAGAAWVEVWTLARAA